MSILAKNISFSYNGKSILKNINIEIESGKVHCLVGKNGSGKSTLLRILTGDLKPNFGQIFIDNIPIQSFSIKDLAISRSVLSQETKIDFPFTVKEVCFLGRSPHIKTNFTSFDETIVKKSLRLVDNWKLRNSLIQKISGGEKQRTQLARVISQIWTNSKFYSKYLLLDEPISSLDIQHQIQVLKILKLLSQKGLGVLLILHDLNLASAFSDTISLLKDGNIIQSGSPKLVLTKENLKLTFDIETKIFYDQDLNQVLIHPIKFKEKKMVKKTYSKEELAKIWEEYKISNPKKRIRDAASDLKVSEAELLATGLGKNVTQLKPLWKEIISKVANLGYVMALTRNEACVHERKGAYKNISFNGNIGLVVGEDIDLRIFYNHWQYGFAVYENLGEIVRKSLQFFDKSGTAIHKIYLQEKSNHSAFNELVDEFRMNEVYEITVEESTQKNIELSDSEIDVHSFLKEWSELQDTHDFWGLTQKYKLTRTQALRLAEGKFTKKLDTSLISKVLQKACESEVEIMIFVGNPGMIQIHTGKVVNYKVIDNWVNILDPEFNLHLRQDLIENLWFVKKPTKDGEVHSLEAFDNSGEMIIQIFGKRKPGIPESLEWRSLLFSLV